MSYSLNVIKEQLSDTVRNFRTGYYRASSANGTANLMISLSEIHLYEAVYNNNTVVTEKTITTVYYR